MDEQLDTAVLDIFQVLEDLYQKQEALEQAMKDGFFTMARARYNMGVKRVSADQIVDADLTACRTVELKESIPDDQENESETLQDVFVLCNTKGSGDKRGENSTSHNDKLKKDIESSLRKRGTGAPTADLEKEFKECLKLIDGDEDDKKFKLKNPINLFGVLVPQALRSSQTSFEEAVGLSVEIANQKHKLEMLQKKFADLKQKYKLSNKDDSQESVEKKS